MRDEETVGRAPGRIAGDLHYVADCEERQVFLVVTGHAAIDWGLIAGEADIVVDTRNAMAPFTPIPGLLVQA